MYAAGHSVLYGEFVVGCNKTNYLSSDDVSLKDQEPFPLLLGENIEFIGCSCDEQVIAMTNYRLFATVANGFWSVSCACS